jgi:hypothetical protein
MSDPSDEAEETPIQRALRLKQAAIEGRPGKSRPAMRK